MNEAIEQFLHDNLGRTDTQVVYDDDFLNRFLELGPLHYFIPKSMGGRLEDTDTYMKVVETAAYYSVPLGLSLGITGSLFLLPILKYASRELLDRILPGFITGTELGGMMITEPTGGTNIFGLKSTLSPADNGYTLNGLKCWGGLTGRAEHWLVAGRVKRGNKVTRRVNMVYVSLDSEGVRVENYFDALGLHPIPYGLTSYTDVAVPEEHLLTRHGKSSLQIIYDTLFRSRLGMPSISEGTCRRLTDEVTSRGDERVVFNNPIGAYDQVQYRIASVRGLYQANHYLARFTSAWMQDHDDVSGDYLLVNTSKVISSESMSTAADASLHIFASAAFKRTHYVGRALIDSRPFQIFEGSNDVLHENTYEAIVAAHDRVDLETITSSLATYGLALSDQIPPATRELLDREDQHLTQRQKAQYGRIIAWVVMLSIIERLSDTDTVPTDDACRVALVNMAGMTAELPYMG